MSMPKIVLFYVFTPLADPEAIRLWQKALAEKWDLKGRVIISKDGINATLGGGNLTTLNVIAVKRVVMRLLRMPILSGLRVRGVISPA